MHLAMGRRLMICFVLAWTIPLFAAGIRFVRVPQGGIQPQAVIDSRGFMHLVYFSGDPKQGDVFYVHSSDNGATFSTPLRVNSQPGSAIALGTIRGAQIAVGRNGRVHVAWNGSGIALPEGVLNPEAGKPGSPTSETPSSGHGLGLAWQKRRKSLACACGRTTRLPCAWAPARPLVWVLSAPLRAARRTLCALLDSSGFPWVASGVGIWRW